MTEKLVGNRSPGFGRGPGDPVSGAGGTRRTGCVACDHAGGDLATIILRDRYIGKAGRPGDVAPVTLPAHRQCGNRQTLPASGQQAQGLTDPACPLKDGWGNQRRRAIPARTVRIPPAPGAAFRIDTNTEG